MHFELSIRPARCKLVITDAVFSMDGDVADVPALLALCERHGALAAGAGDPTAYRARGHGAATHRPVGGARALRRRAPAAEALAGPAASHP